MQREGACCLAAEVWLGPMWDLGNWGCKVTLVAWRGSAAGTAQSPFPACTLPVVYLPARRGCPVPAVLFSCNSSLCSPFQQRCRHLGRPRPLAAQGRRCSRAVEAGKSLEP